LFWRWHFLLFWWSNVLSLLLHRDHQHPTNRPKQLSWESDSFIQHKSITSEELICTFLLVRSSFSLDINNWDCNEQISKFSYLQRIGR
jgi:hypothetical protein